MRSKPDSKLAPTTSSRSVINHEYLVTEDTNVIGIYRKGGILSIYLETTNGITKFAIDRGDSFNTKTLPGTLAARWTKEELVRNAENAELIRGIRGASNDTNEIQVTPAELQFFQGVLIINVGNYQTEDGVNEVLQNALGKLTQRVDMQYSPSQQMSYCAIL